MSSTDDAIQGLSSTWWLFLARGVVAILFAALTLVSSPGITSTVLVYLFGAYALLDGVIALWLGSGAAMLNRRTWPWFVVGLAGCAAGLLSFLKPDVMAQVLVYLIAAWAIVTGAAQVVIAVALRKTIDGEWVLGLAGIISVVFGIFLVLMAAQPGGAARALVGVIAAYALVLGTALVVLAFRVRGLQGHAQHGEATS